MYYKDHTMKLQGSLYVIEMSISWDPLIQDITSNIEHGCWMTFLILMLYTEDFMSLFLIHFYFNYSCYVFHSSSIIIW